SDLFKDGQEKHHHAMAAKPLVACEIREHSSPQISYAIRVAPPRYGPGFPPLSGLKAQKNQETSSQPHSLRICLDQWTKGTKSVPEKKIPFLSLSLSLVVCVCIWK
ncbi:hypothetical protein Pfo_031100, partial [Paulownia fortunei]